MKRNELDNPVLECMCGHVISGVFDPSKPFFTMDGSFWTNSTSELLAATTEEDRQGATRNRCHGEGYESVALIPLRADDKTIGLIQLNDSRRDFFTPNTIALIERVASQLTLALVKHQIENALRESEARFKSLAANLPDVVARFDKNLRHLYVNPTAEKMTGISTDFFIGKSNEELGMPQDLVNLWQETLLRTFESGAKTTVEFDYETPKDFALSKRLLRRNLQTLIR